MDPNIYECILTLLKALLWCRSDHFRNLLADPKLKHIDVDIPSPLLAHLLDYINDGYLDPHDIEELMALAQKVKKLDITKLGNFIKR